MRKQKNRNQTGGEERLKKGDQEGVKLCKLCDFLCPDEKLIVTFGPGRDKSIKVEKGNPHNLRVA